MKKSSVLTLTKGVVFSYLISGICLLILAFLLFQFELPEGVEDRRIDLSPRETGLIDGVQHGTAQQGDAV